MQTKSSKLSISLPAHHSKHRAPWLSSLPSLSSSSWPQALQLSRCIWKQSQGAGRCGWVSCHARGSWVPLLQGPCLPWLGPAGEQLPMARQGPGLAPTTSTGLVGLGEKRKQVTGLYAPLWQESRQWPFLKSVARWDASVPATRSASISLQRCQRQASQLRETDFRE